MQPILEICGITKEYHLGQSFNQTDTFREVIQRTVGSIFNRSGNAQGARKPRAAESFLALNDVSFSVNQGEVVGIIGRNGAGKSTLLKIVSRITDPTSGAIKLRGRMASLLEVGTGFHPELTGRENIYMNGAILGMRKAEITRKFDEIVAFAEVEKFLDTPVKHYSSGMYVRLAFSVAAHLEPEILIVDEVLAVGDMAFQKKCLGKMNEVSRGGRTVLLVTHNMAAIENLCKRSVVLERGRLVYDGNSKEAVQHYLKGISGTADNDGHVIDLANSQTRKGTGQQVLKRLELYTDDDKPLITGIGIGARVKLCIYFELPSRTASFEVGIGFDNNHGQRIFTAHSSYDPNRQAVEREGMQCFTCDIPSFTLMPGEYTIRIWLNIGIARADATEDVARITVLESDYYGTGKVPKAGMIVMKQNWQLQP